MQQVHWLIDWLQSDWNTSTSKNVAFKENSQLWNHQQILTTTSSGICVGSPVIQVMVNGEQSGTYITLFYFNLALKVLFFYNQWWGSMIRTHRRLNTWESPGCRTEEASWVTKKSLWIKKKLPSLQALEDDFLFYYLLMTVAPVVKRND